MLVSLGRTITLPIGLHALNLDKRRLAELSSKVMLIQVQVSPAGEEQILASGLLPARENSTMIRSLFDDAVKLGDVRSIDVLLGLSMR